MASPILRLYAEAEKYRSLSADLNDIDERIRSYYEPQIAKAGFIRRAYLRFRMNEELRAEVEKLAPRIARLLGSR